jgi:integrase
MVPLITVGKPGCHLNWTKDGKLRLTIPAELFKNGTSEVFKSGPYVRDLVDREGFHADLKEYLDLARPRLLDGKTDDHLFLSWSAKNGGGAVSSQVTRNELTEITAGAIGINAPSEKRLIRENHLRPHHFRDILATSVLRKTNRNFALAGDAIHVTEETARQYYAYDTVEQRRPELQRILAGI